MIAFECEAAALLTMEQELCRLEKNGNVELLPFTPQSNLMIIDLGGKNLINSTYSSVFANLLHSLVSVSKYQYLFLSTVHLFNIQR